MANSASSSYPSPASSTTSLPFPQGVNSPTQESFRSNPHPYAIRTTSTGILTRSNSTHSTSSASHRFVPSSPNNNKPKVNQQRSRQGGHRYSRSLTTTELPRPLPVPPNFPSSASPTQTEFDPQDVSVVYPRGKRSDSLPQTDFLGDNVVDERELGLDDPRTWTPSQLSTYLSSSLRVTSGDLPELVQKDIATFALTQRITGRKFLRLTEADLNKYGLNQRWQNALLKASRALRKDSLRGRIWNTEQFPDDQDAEEGLNASHSSASSSDSSKELQRGRPSNSDGRVRGMVASFERNGPSRSESPSKASLRSLDSDPVKPHYSETNSSAFRSRPRPYSDTFPSYNPMSPPLESPITSANTLAGDVDQKKEPRLLPYPPSSPQQISSEYTSFTMVPHQPTGAFSPPAFGPYGSPLPPPPPQESSSSPFTSFPSGALPFSPQSTGTSASLSSSLSSSESPKNPITPISPDISLFVPQPPTQSFDAIYNVSGSISALSEGGNGVGVGIGGNGGGVARPLPLPPHSGQFYHHQSLVSASAPQDETNTFVGFVTRDGDYNLSPSLSSNAAVVTTAPTPHGLTKFSSLVQPPPPSPPPPHVQIQHVSGEQQETRAPALVDITGLDTQHLPSYLPHQQQQHQQPHQTYHHNHQLLSSSLSSSASPQSIQILAPQPRHGGRESPTKILEEKLEELLEPRPRSRVFPGQHSRVPSGTGSVLKGENPSLSYSPTPSRPTSRVPSMKGKSKEHQHHHHLQPNTTINSGDDVGNVNNNMNTHVPQNGSPLAGHQQQQQQHQPRTRVISLSSRPHAHRLSGVEAWGESHRHVVVPPSEDLNSTTEEAGVKELEGDEEVGIEALLEKEAPALPLPLVVPATPTTAANDDVTMIPGHHVKESSNGSNGSGGSIAHSRSGSLREPKSSVITVVERIPSSKLFKPDDLEGEDESDRNRIRGMATEEEESMEALLAKSPIDSSLEGVGSGSGSGGSNSLRKRGNTKKRRTPLSGAEAWEMVNIDTVKYVEGDGMNRSIENIFSPLPRPPSATITTPIPHGPRPIHSPSPQNRNKLKPKSRKSLDGSGGSGDVAASTAAAGDMEMKMRLDDLERREQQLEKSMDETRKMVEEMKGRLELVERWIVQKEEMKEQGGNGRINMWRVLSASRVPGMLGLSAWFGVPSSSSPSNIAQTASPAGKPHHQGRTTSLIQRIARMGLSLGTYTVLFGIGFCVVLLRALGKRWQRLSEVAAIVRLGEIGARIRDGLKR